jgi:hypothetical protein
MSRTQAVDPTKKTSADYLARQANLYALAAAAAGVSMLASALPAMGEVIFTKKTIPIPLSPIGEGVGISLTNNGIKDFILSLFKSYSQISTRGYQSVRITSFSTTMRKGMPGRGVVGKTGTNSFAPPYASALMRGAKIGPDARFMSSGRGEGVEAVFGSGSFRGKTQRGEWDDNPKDRFLGVRFLISGETHYGWIRLTVITKPGPLSATITGYAYESLPNKPILAGTSAQDEPNVRLEMEGESGGPPLGMLALGAEATPLWRQKEPAPTETTLSY